MAGKQDKPNFFQLREDVLERLDFLRKSILECLGEGYVGPEDSFYNQCLALIDDAHILDNWDEMDELVTRAKLLETDVATWLALKGRTSVSIEWPHRSRS